MDEVNNLDMLKATINVMYEVAIDKKKMYLHLQDVLQGHLNSNEITIYEYVELKKYSEEMFNEINDRKIKRIINIIGFSLTMLFILFQLTGCSAPTKVVAKEESRFEVIEEETLKAGGQNHVITIIRDKDTKNKYLVVGQADGVAITPLLTKEDYLR